MLSALNPGEHFPGRRSVSAFFISMTAAYPGEGFNLSPSPGSVGNQAMPEATFDLSNLKITPTLKSWLVETLDCPSTWTDDSLYVEQIEQIAKSYGDLSSEKQKALKLLVFDQISQGDEMPDPTKIFQSGNGNIDVKEPSSRYDETRYAVKNKFGERVMDPVHQHECLGMSEASKARHGVLFKHLANKSGLVNNPLTEHEKQLLSEVCEKQEWCGQVGGEWYDSISPHRNVKALIDDSTSGGLEIVPIEFDSDVITFPLLGGELLPMVDLKPVPRGRRIEGASINTPTLSWGGGDDNSISIFSTTDLVAAIDTTIHVVDGCIEVGRDFLSDSPVNVGQVLTALIGERLMNELDKVIANGNGSTQPEGLFQASGVSTVTPDNTTTGPPSSDDYYDLMFTVQKEYRKPALKPAFVSNEVSYVRSRKIHVDPTSPSTTDQRPVLAPVEQVSTYMNLGYPHLINHDLANGTAGFFCMAKYRLYRRLGLEIQWINPSGKELARRNMMLLCYRARYGGKLMDANAGAKWTNGQS